MNPCKRLTGAAALLALALSIPGCKDFELRKPRAFGREKEILVICSNEVWQAIRKDLRAKIEQPVHAVHWESIFEIAQISPDKVSHLKEWDKIILIESLENMKLLPKVVNKAMLDTIAAGQGLFFTNFDIWARGQRVVGLAAPRDDQIPALVRFHGERIFKDFLHQLEEREKIRMFYSGADTLRADSLAARYGFSIILPRIYRRIREDSLPANELLFVHTNPVRSIFVTWEESPELRPTDFSRKALASSRDSLLKSIYPGMHTISERVDTSTVVAGGLERHRIYGAWENRAELSGGIYISQVIDVPGQHRRYLIDCLLFCPDPRRNKYRFILQLDWILNSFKPVV